MTLQPSRRWTDPGQALSCHSEPRVPGGPCLAEPGLSAIASHIHCRDRQDSFCDHTTNEQCNTSCNARCVILCQTISCRLLRSVNCWHCGNGMLHPPGSSTAVPHSVAAAEQPDKPGPVLHSVAAAEQPDKPGPMKSHAMWHSLSDKHILWQSLYHNSATESEALHALVVAAIGWIQCLGGLSSGNLTRRPLSEG